MRNSRTNAKDRRRVVRRKHPWVEWTYSCGSWLAERIHERMNGLMKGREHKDTMWERENRGIIWEIIICFSTAIVVANNNKLEACSSSSCLQKAAVDGGEEPMAVPGINGGLCTFALEPFIGRIPRPLGNIVAIQSETLFYHENNVPTGQ